MSVRVWLSEMKFLDVLKDELPRKHPPRDSFTDHGRKRLGTVVDLTTDHVDQGLVVVSFFFDSFSTA